MVALASAGVTSKLATGVSSTVGISMGASFSSVLGLLPQAPMDSRLIEREREISGIFEDFKPEIFGGTMTKRVGGRPNL